MKIDTFHATRMDYILTNVLLFWHSCYSCVFSLFDVIPTDPNTKQIFVHVAVTILRLRSEYENSYYFLQYNVYLWAG